MATHTASHAPFEPLLSREQVLDGLSPEMCRQRDVSRRITAMVCTRTADELSGIDDVAKLVELKQVVDGLLASSEAEVEFARAASARLKWAIETHGFAVIEQGGN